MLLADSVAPPSYYEGLANELDSIAKALSDTPRLHDHLAGRLRELAQQMRDDVRLMAVKARLN